MTKEEKLQKVCVKIRKADNKLTTQYYYKTKLERATTEMLDVYNPIFFKYNQHLMTEKNISLTLFCDDSMSVWSLGYRTNSGKENEVCKYEILPLDQISEEMLDEMLAVKDCGEIIQARMTDKSMEYTYNDYLAKKNKEVAKENECKAQTKKSKQDKWNDFNFVLSLIALGVSLIALIVKL